MNQEAERDEISAERDWLITEINETYALINLLLTEVLDGTDSELKKKIQPFKSILKNCNVWIIIQKL